LKRYPAYYQYAVEGGMSPDLARKYADEMETELDCLDRRVCPRCDKPIQRVLDPRQVGPKADDQAFFNYRCPCGYMSDRAE
jgi:hypothetical protein